MSLALPSNLFISFWHLHFQKLNMERSQRKSVDAVHLTETLEMSTCWAWIVIMWWVHYVSKISCRLMLEERNRSCRVHTKSIVGHLWHLLTWKQRRFLYNVGEMLNQLSKCLRCSGHRFEWITLKVVCYFYKRFSKSRKPASWKSAEMQSVKDLSSENRNAGS